MKERKQNEKRRNKRMLLLLLLLFMTGTMLVTSTYAWFTANRVVTINALDVHVEASNGIQISTDGVTWKSVITRTDIISGAYDNSEKGSDRSATVLRCLELKQKLLLEDLNINKDESTALNVSFIAMSREDFEALETVEVNKGGNNGRELSADFGVSEDTDSFEARLKADAKERLKKLEEDKDGNAS